MQPDQNTTTSRQAALPGPAAHAVSAVLAGLNHEIRTAMNGIVGMLDLLLESGLPPTQRDLASTAQHNAEYLVGFIEAAVDLVAIGEGCLHLELRPFELSSVLRSALDTVAIPGLRPVHALPAALLCGDAGRIRQILSGMLRIAGSMGIPLDMNASAERRDGQCAVTIDVVCGECCEAVAHVRELMGSPSADVEVVRRYGILGLDVQLCKRLAELMGGSVSVHESPQASHVLRLAFALPLAAPSLEGGRMLIIEKNNEDRQALKALFSRHGMEVHALASTGPALEILRSKGGRLHAAIIGRDEQGFDAEFLAAAIKADPQSAGLRLVALCDASEAPGGLPQASFDAIVSRPLDEAAALAAVMSLCGQEPDFFVIPSPASRQDFSGRRILVADDNSVNLQVARRMLEKRGCRVDVAADGAQALAMHQAAPYELILMDCQMPGMDGREAVTRIRALGGEAGRVPVVAVTACATPSERECCLAAGMDDFIAKPLRPQVLDAALTRWLRELPAVSAKTPAAESPCRDELDAVREMFGADFAELARLYRNDSPPRIAALRDAGSAGDCAAVAKVAHAFSGSSASIGASGLAALCKELELHAKTGSLDGFSGRMQSIESEYERICGRLDSLLAQETSWRKN